jgi:hypothetical protein
VTGVLMVLKAACRVAAMLQISFSMGREYENDITKVRLLCEK